MSAITGNTLVLQNALNEYFDNPAANGALDKLYATAVSCNQEDHEIIEHIFIRNNIKQTIASKGLTWVKSELVKGSSEIKEDRLDTLDSSKILEIAENIFSANSCQICSDVAKLPPEHAAGHVNGRYARESYQISLNAPINQGIQKVAIAGDGHCMFRSFSFSLLQQFFINPDAKAALLARLQHLKDAVDSQTLAAFPEVKSHIDEVIRGLNDARDPFEKLNDPSITDKLVKAMRYLACARNFSKDTFMALFEAGQMDRYLREMQDMSFRKYGSQEEFSALADLFGVTVLSFNFTSKEVSIARPEFQLGADRMFVTLHFNPGHYDALVMDPVHAQSIFDASSDSESVRFRLG